MGLGCVDNWGAPSVGAFCAVTDHMGFVDGCVAGAHFGEDRRFGRDLNGRWGLSSIGGSGKYSSTSHRSSVSIVDLVDCSTRRGQVWGNCVLGTMFAEMLTIMGSIFDGEDSAVAIAQSILIRSEGDT